MSSRASRRALRAAALSLVTSFATLVVVPAGRPLAAQTPLPTASPVHDAANVWVAYTGNHHLTSRVGLHLEAQLRRDDGIALQKQTLLRPGVHWYVTKTLTATAGYGYVHTSPGSALSEPIAITEHRLWEQLSLSTAAGRFTIANRARLEQRWEPDVVKRAPTPPYMDGYKYNNRARYQVRVSHPLHRGAPGARGLYATAFDEAFLRVGSSAAGRHFRQNRAFVGLGYRRSAALRMEAGYMQQLVVPARGPARERNHTLSLSLFSEAWLGGR